MVVHLISLEVLGGFGKGIHISTTFLYCYGGVIGKFLGFSVGSTVGPSLMVSHLLFIDDTLIFCDAESS